MLLSLFLYFVLTSGRRLLKDLRRKRISENYSFNYMLHLLRS